MRYRFLAALALVLAVVFVGAGCGDSGSGEARKVLDETFGDQHPIDSGNLDLSLRVTGKGAGLEDSPIELTVSGPFITTDKSQLPKFALELGTVGSGDTKGGFVSTGTKGYVTIGDQAFVLADKSYKELRDSYAKTQRENEAQQKDSTGLSALGIDPAEWLGDDTTVSDSEIGGQPTTRVAGPIDVKALLDDVGSLIGQAGTAAKGATGANTPTEIDDEQKAAIARSVKTAKVSIDTGREDRTLRAISLRLILEVAEEDRDKLGGLEKLDVDLTLSISQLNAVKSIPVPKNPQPIDDLQKALADAVAQSGSSGGGTATTPDDTATTPSPSTGTGDKQQQYADCLQKAGDDVAAIQRCADVINR